MRYFYSPLQPDRFSVLTQPSVQWVPGSVSPGVKQQGRETDHFPQTSAQVKNGGALPLLPPHLFMT
jgi:hypothetical protein